jgi:hypothetical protein
LRTLGQLLALYDQPLKTDFAAMREAALEVPLLRAEYVSFYQHHWSNRSQQGRPLHGVMGSGLYGPVPRALVPFLIWGGRVHVGIDRVAGAGSWRVTVGEQTAPTSAGARERISSRSRCHCSRSLSVSCGRRLQGSPRK